MKFELIVSSLLLLLPSTAAEQWPYNRVRGEIKESGEVVPDKSQPEPDEELGNRFVGWLRDVVKNQNITRLEEAFLDGSISDDAKRFRDLLDGIEVPANATPKPILKIPTRPNYPYKDANQLFEHMNLTLDPLCLVDRSRWWYRTEDGACNWLKQGESRMGAVGTPRVRDYDQHAFADGISEPREGPNARAVSNAFFKRKKRLSYEHTPLLLGLIEFIMHDITYSQDSTTEYIEVPMPSDETEFAPNTTFKVWRSATMPGTGTDRKNPRENVNMATTWLDLSSLYGSTFEVQKGLRSFSQGKLLSQEVQARGTKSKASYLPWNTMNVPTNTRPYQDPAALFGGGDPRTNEDWMLLGVHTLLLREHNRLCDILIEQHPDWEDEQLFQTTRLIMSAKYALIANSYQMAYWTDEMPWPKDDGYPLYRQMYGASALEINPANTYPWPLVTKKGKPMVVSAEMSVLYRFHEFIISTFPIIDGANNVLWTQSLFGTGFNATGFLDTGLENVLRGMVSTDIPNFKSGVDESFRSAGSGKSDEYRGKPFDIVTWSITHEREQGLPTFNQYFTEYNKQDPAVVVPIRQRFEDFSSDPEMVSNLKKLYKTPDDVDFVVGAQLDEEYFPGTTVPKSALIVSLFSLFGMGNSDRFSIGFAMMRCLLVDKPWDCHPSNALEDLIWKREESKEFPDFRFYDQFWVTELDLQAHGSNLLWRLITENTEIKCVQKSPLFPASENNPLLCALPKAPVDVPGIFWTALEVTLALIKQHGAAIIAAALGIAGVAVLLAQGRRLGQPPVLAGWPILGNALAFNSDPKSLLLKGFHKFQPSVSGVFGIKLASLTHYVLTNKEDLQLMKKDNPFEVKFNLHSFFQAINIAIITKKENFDSDIHTTLIRDYFSNPKTLNDLATVVEDTARSYVEHNPLPTDEKLDNLTDYFSHYVTFVVSRCVVGTQSYDNQELLATFEKFNDDAVKAMGLSSLLPSFLQFIASYSINHDFESIRNALIPVIEAKREEKPALQKETAFIDIVLEVIDNNERAVDIIAIAVWVGLINLQSSFGSVMLDIINQPGLQHEIASSLAGAKVQDLDTFKHDSSSPWNSLRSAAFESIRLCGPVTGPARMCSEDIQLRSDPSLTLPKGQPATLSVYYTHRKPDVWGPDADRYVAQRFVDSDPPIGEPEYISWGLAGPHACPGRWYAMQAIMIAAKVLFETYDFQQYGVVPDSEKYTYSAGNVGRKKVGITVKRR